MAVPGRATSTREASTLRRTLLLAGATGFVGGAVLPALQARGWHIRGLTRRVAGRAHVPGLEWVEGDAGDAGACARALDDRDTALYLVHGTREIVVGLAEDLLAGDDRFRQLIDHPRRQSFATAASRALAAERQAGPVRGAWGFVERRRRPVRT